jgi:hypothetical protein
MAKYLPAFPTDTDELDRLQRTLAGKTELSRVDPAWLYIYEDAGLVYSPDETALLERMDLQMTLDETVNEAVNEAIEAVRAMRKLEPMRKLLVTMVRMQLAHPDDERRLRDKHTVHMRTFYRALEKLRIREKEILSEIPL